MDPFCEWFEVNGHCVWRFYFRTQTRQEAAELKYGAVDTFVLRVPGVDIAGGWDQICIIAEAFVVGIAVVAGVQPPVMRKIGMLEELLHLPGRCFEFRRLFESFSDET